MWNVILSFCCTVIGWFLILFPTVGYSQSRCLIILMQKIQAWTILVMNHSPVQGNAQCQNQTFLEVESLVQMLLWLVSAVATAFFLHAMFGVKHVYRSVKVKKGFVVLDVKNVVLKLIR